MSILKFFKSKVDSINCIVHKEIGCSHVDGMLCDPQICSIKMKYKYDWKQLHIKPKEPIGSSLIINK